MTYSSALYDSFMYPFEKLILHSLRKRLVGHVKGHVLEIGTGTGVNVSILPCEKITSYVGMDIKVKPEVYEKLKTKQCPFELIESSVESLPFEDQVFDTVFFTLVFCSVEHPEIGLDEVYRVLKPGGKVIFIEHVLSDQPILKRMMKSVTPYWSKLASGCRLDRSTHLDIESKGFKVIYKEFSLQGVFVGGVAKKE